jgi:hypothetical protein
MTFVFISACLRPTAVAGTESEKAAGNAGMGQRTMLTSASVQPAAGAGTEGEVEAA